MLLAPWLVACGTAPDHHTQDKADHTHDDRDHETVKGDVEHVHPPGTEAGDGHAHNDASDHMAAMRRTRDALRTDLGPAYDQPVPGLDAADAGSGKTIYEQHCVSCHGVSGKADGPAAAALDPKPGDFTDAFHARFYSDAGRLRIIEQGAPQTSMVGFAGALDADQRLAVYAYIRTFRQ